ncbi:unnamed protein product [Caretta caretta]
MPQPVATDVNALEAGLSPCPKPLKSSLEGAASAIVTHRPAVLLDGKPGAGGKVEALLKGGSSQGYVGSIQCWFTDPSPSRFARPPSPRPELGDDMLEEWLLQVSLQKRMA